MNDAGNMGVKPMNDRIKKILILTANSESTSRLRLDEEIRSIHSGLARSRQREQFEIIQKWAVRPRDIQRAMLDTNPQIVHFSGHGTGQEGLIFEDESGQGKLIDGQSLARLFDLFSEQLECVILNGCYSEIQAKSIVKYIEYVIGMSREISDKAAIEFAIGFYDALCAGRSIEFAYNIACSAISMAGISEQLIPDLLKRKTIDDNTENLHKDNIEKKPDISYDHRIKIFLSYSHEDEKLRDILAKHLCILERQQIIQSWYDRDIAAGTEWAGEISEQLQLADIILLLISADFLASDYCYDIEMKRAMERHDAGKARVIPIILRPVEWSSVPFSKLQALPIDAKPITSWDNIDLAFVNVAKGIRLICEEILREEKFNRSKKDIFNQ